MLSSFWLDLVLPCVCSGLTISGLFLWCRKPGLSITCAGGFGYRLASLKTDVCSLGLVWLWSGCLRVVHVFPNVLGLLLLSVLFSLVHVISSRHVACQRHEAMPEALFGYSITAKGRPS